MNVKKASSPYTIVRERDQSSAITLRRLFNLWAIFCCFTFAAGQSSALLSSTAKKSAFLDSTSGVSSAISAYSSHSVPINNPSENVSHTNTSSLTSLHNKTGIITMLQSSNFAVTGSTEPIALALSFITTSTSVPSVPRSVRSLLDASSFSIAGFTEPLRLALFTSESLSSNESIASLSTSTGPSSSHVANASTPSHAIVTMSEEANASAAKPTFSNSIKPQNSSAFGLESVAASTPSHQSVIRSVASNLYQPSSGVSTTSPQASTSTQSSLQSFTKTVLLSSAQNVSSVSRTVMYLGFSIMSVLSQGSSEVTQTSPFFSEASPVKTDTAISVTLSMSLLNFSSSATVSVLSVTQAPPYSIVSSGSLIQLSSKMHQSRITQAATRSVSEVNVGSISTNESVSGYSANVTLSLNISSVIPTAQMPESSSLSSSTFRTTILLSHSLSMDPSSFASYSTRDGSNSSVISTPLLQNESVSDSQYYSESRLAASQHISTSLPFLTASVVKTSFSAIDVQSKVQSSLTVSVRSMTIHSHALVSSYVLPQRFSSDKSSTDTRGALSTAVFSHVTPNVSFDVMQLSTAVLPDSLDTVYSLTVSSVEMSTSKYFFSSPLDYSVSTATQPSTTRSKASPNSSAAFLSKSSSVFTLSTLPIMRTAISSSVSRMMSVSPTKSVLAVNSSTVVKTASSFADLSISPGSEQLQPYSSRKSHKSTIVIPGESTSLTLHERSSVTLSQSSSVITPERKLSSETLAIIATSAPSYERTKSSHSIPLATTSYSLLTQSPRLATEPNGTASTTPLPDTIHPQTDEVSRPSTEVLSSFTRSIVLSTNKATSTASPRTDPTSDDYTPTSSLMHMTSLSTVTQTLLPQNTRSALSQSYNSTGVPVETSRFTILSSSRTETLSSSNSLVSSPSLTLLSFNSPVVTYSNTTSWLSLKSSSAEIVSSSSIATSPQEYVRFGISVPQNQSLNNRFRIQLQEDILSVYQNGSAASSGENITLHIVELKRTPDTSSTNVTVIFQVLNASAPLPGYSVVESVRGATLRLGEALGYTVVEDPFPVFFFSSSAFTMSTTSSRSSPMQLNDVTSISQEIPETSYVISTRQPNVSSTAGGVTVTTSTSLASSFSFKPSTPELVFSSSVIAIPTGFFVRFVIRVDLNQSVSNASFVGQLQKGILEAYENGSADIALANVSVDIIQIARSPDANSSIVNVTFRVLNGSEPLLAYTVIQGISNDNVTLAEAVKYEVIVSPFTVYLPSSSASSMLMTLTMMPQTRTQSISQSSSEGKPSSSHDTIRSSFLRQSTSKDSVGHISLSIRSLRESVVSPSMSSPLSRSISVSSLSVHTGRLFSTKTEISSDFTTINTSSHLSVAARKTERFSSDSSTGIEQSDVKVASSSITLKPSSGSLALISVTISTDGQSLSSTKTSQPLSSSSALRSSQVKASPPITLSRSSHNLGLTFTARGSSESIELVRSLYSSSDLLLQSPQITMSPSMALTLPNETLVSNSQTFTTTSRATVVLSHSTNSLTGTPQTRSTGRGALASSQTLRLLSSSSGPKLRSSEVTVSPTITLLRATNSLPSTPQALSTSRGALDFSDTSRLLSSSSALIMRSSEVIMSSSMMLSRSTTSLALTSQTLPTARGTLDLNETSRILPSSSVLAMESSEVTVSPSPTISRSKDSLPLNRQTVSTTAEAMDFSETLLPLSSPLVVIMRSSEVTVSPAMTLSRLRHSLSFTPQTVSTVRGALDSKETLQYMSSSPFYILPSSEFRPFRTLSSDSLVLSSLSSISTATGSLYTNETLRLLSSLTSLKLQSTEVNIRSQVSRVASSLPVLLRLSTDFMTFQSTSSSAASLSHHSLRTLNETAYQRPSSTDFIISPPTPSQESTLSPQPSPQRPLSTGFMSSHSAFYIATSSSSNVSRSLNDTRGVLHGTSSTSPFFSSLTSVQGSTLSLQSSPLKALFTDTMPSQSASLMPRHSSFNLSSALHSSSSGAMKFPSLASSKESTLSTMMTLTKVSSSEVITASVLPSSFSMSTDISATPLISSMLLIATTRTRLSLTPTISGLVISSSPVIDTRTNFTLSSMFVPQSSPLEATSVVKPSGSDLSANMTNVLISTASKNATIVSIPTGNDSTPHLSQLTSLEASHTSRSRSTSHRTSLLSETSRISIMGRNTFGITSTYAVSRNIDSSSYFSFIRSGFVATSSFTSLVSYSVLIDATSTTPLVNRTSTTLNLSHTISLITNNTTRSNATSTVKLSSQAAGNMSDTLGASLVKSSVVGTTVAPIITQVVGSSEIRTADVTASFSKVIFSSLSFPSIVSSTVTSVIESLNPERTASRGAFKTSVLQTMSSQSALLSSHSSKGFSKMDSFATTSPLHKNTSEITLPPITFIVSSKESRAMSIDTSQSVTRSSIEDGVSSFLSLDAFKIYSSTRRIFSSTLTSVASQASLHVKPSASLLTSTLNLLPSSNEFSKGKSIPFPTINQSSMRTTDVDSSLKVDSSTLSFSYSMKVDSTLGTSIAILTKSGLLPSMTMIEEETSSFLEESLTYSTTGVSTRLPATGFLSSVAPFQPTLSFLPQARSSLFPMLPSSYKPIMTSTSVDISLQLSSAASRESLSFQTYMSASVFVSLPTTLEDATPSLTAARFSLVSKSSPGAVTSVEPTEPILTSKPNTTEGEGLVGIQILVPQTENETHPTFKEIIELRLAAAYRWGLEKANTRAKRDVKWIEDTPVEPVLMTWNVKNFNSWKQSPSFKVYEKRASRFRRQIDNIAAVVEVIRRAKPIVGEEVVDIEYRMFDGSAMLSAEHIVKTLNRLSEAELVTTLKYAVTLRPYVVREVQVTPTPAASKWDIWLPAIIVPSCIALFLLIALILAKCVAKRKRKQLIIKPTEIHPYETVEIKTLPPKNTKNRHGPPKKKRSSISSSSSSSSSDTLQRTPTLPVPDYSPRPTDTPKKPNQNYRRRTNGKYSDQKNITSYSTKEVIIENKHVQHGRALKKSKDTRDYAETDHPAGVLENRPQMRDERLVHNFKREEPPLRFTSLPPLVQTPLVGPKPSVPDTTADARTDYVRIIAESGVPQANVERWRNKMRHREKLRQYMRDKEQEREQMLKQLEKERKEGNHQSMAEDQASSSQRSLTAERKRKSRLERWRQNRVGTSSSRSSSSDRSSSSSSSSSSGSDSVSKKKHGKKERKGKKKQMRDKKKNEKMPSLATGHESKATAQEALRETAWTIKETPGVRLVSVKPITEQRRPEGTSSPTHLPPTSTQRDRIQYLLDTGYQMLPMVSTPVVQPFETQNRDDEQVYEDMDGLDPHAVQYGEDHYPPEPRHAFGGPSVYEDEHIYEEPTIGPSWLPQTHYAVSPRESQTRAMIPTQYARGYTGGAPMSRGRPTSASHPGLSRTARTRPTSARTDPMPRYAPSPGKTSPSKRSFAAPAVPGSRYMLSNQPTVATAAQPSIGTSPRYMVDPERPRDEPPSSFDGARMILSRAQTNINRFEEDSRRNILDKTDTSPTPASLYSRSPKRILVPASMTQKENSSTGTTRLDVAAREHAELEAQLLVSRALARARSNVRT